MSTHKPATREEFKEFILRQLGKPVIEINVSDTQVEDAVETALSYYIDYHYDGSSKTYLKHQITQDTIDTKSITIPETIIGVASIFQLASGGGFSSGNMFSYDYQFSLSMINDISNFSMLDYFLTRTQVEQIQETLLGEFPIRYNRNYDKLYLDASSTKLVLGNWIIVECYTAVNPDTETDVWSDRILQRHATSLLKKTWGMIMSKYEGIQLPGGLTMNGRQIYDDAITELQQIEDEYITNYSLPPEDLIA